MLIGKNYSIYISFIIKTVIPVRLVIPVKLFEKGYTKKWNERIPSHPPTYKIKSLECEVVYNPKHDIEQIFYSVILNKISTEEFPNHAYQSR